MTHSETDLHPERCRAPERSVPVRRNSFRVENVPARQLSQGTALPACQASTAAHILGRVMHAGALQAQCISRRP